MSPIPQLLREVRTAAGGKVEEDDQVEEGGGGESLVLDPVPANLVFQPAHPLCFLPTRDCYNDWHVANNM